MGIEQKNPSSLKTILAVSASLVATDVQAETEALRSAVEDTQTSVRQVENTRIQALPSPAEVQKTFEECMEKAKDEARQAIDNISFRQNIVGGQGPEYVYYKDIPATIRETLSATNYDPETVFEAQQIQTLAEQYYFAEQAYSSIVLPLLRTSNLSFFNNPTYPEDIVPTPEFQSFVSNITALSTEQRTMLAQPLETRRNKWTQEYDQKNQEGSLDSKDFIRQTRRMFILLSLSVDEYIHNETKLESFISSLQDRGFVAEEADAKQVAQEHIGNKSKMIEYLFLHCKNLQITIQQYAQSHPQITHAVHQITQRMYTDLMQ